MLSCDPTTKACTTILRYPNQWIGTAHILGCDEEFYVLEGELTINDRVFGTGDYGFLPAFFSREHTTATSGAVVLTFFEGDPSVVSTIGSWDADQEIHLRTTSMPWTSATDSNVAASEVSLMELRLDPISKERTWLLRIDVTDSKPFEINGLETHPVVEELFVLDGSLCMPCGELNRGAYFWRP